MRAIESVVPAQVLARYRRLHRLARSALGAYRGIAADLSFWKDQEAAATASISHYVKIPFDINDKGEVFEIQPTVVSTRTSSGGRIDKLGNKQVRREDLDRYLKPVWAARQKIRALQEELDPAGERNQAFGQARSAAAEVLRNRFPDLNHDDVWAQV